jgi:PTS system ascorbate-specific IIB component
MNVETVLTQLGIRANVEHMDVSSASSSPADFIITSRELAQGLAGHNAQVVIVNNYFDLNEIKERLQPLL